MEWWFQYGCSTSCNSFQITCLWEPDSRSDLVEAVSFTAEESGERLFIGMVDECERGWDTAGGTLAVAGRGTVTRLLDDEALGANYQMVTVEDILWGHVVPCGIEIVRGAELPPVPGFSVGAGSSEWQVVCEFCCYYGGIAPRFDRLGRLVLAPWEKGRWLMLEVDAAMTSLRPRGQRCGVLFGVLVWDRTTEETQRVADKDFLHRGGRCRRVLTMPGEGSYQAMRYSGTYQLVHAREELRQAGLELPEAFAAWSGELVELDLAKGTGRGLWRARESVCGPTTAGTYTRLTLGKPQRKSGFTWISEQGRRRAEPDGTTLVGRIILPGDLAGVYLAEERRELPVLDPGGYVWRSEEDGQVLVFKTGQAGEASYVADQTCGQDWSLAVGGVFIYSGSAFIHIGGGGTRLTGDALVNGEPVLIRGS